MKQPFSVISIHNKYIEFYSRQQKLNSEFLEVDTLRLPFLFVWSAAVLLQMFFLFEADALICAVFAILGGCLGISYSLRKETLLRSPVGTLMLIGFTFYYFIIPPIATMIEGKSLINNLDEPVLVFIHAFICILALIAAHIFYIVTPLPQLVRSLISERVYRPLGFFTEVTHLQLFMMGALGVLANLISASSGGIYTEESVGIFSKFVQGFYPLMYAPYCIALLPLIGRPHRLNKRDVLALLIYTLIILIISVARNSRGVLFTGVASVIIGYTYGVAVQLLPKPKFLVRSFVITALLLATISGPISDFATAMVVVRGQRSDLSAISLISATFDQSQDKDGLKRYRIESAVETGDWDEVYVNNLFLSRLSNLKFSDQSIILAMTLDQGGRDFLTDLELQRVLSILPQPVIDFLGVDANKAFVTSASGGDLMLFAATGAQYALGGFRTGSLLGSGYALFGWLYPIVLAMIMVLIFSFADAQIYKKRELVSQIKNSTPILFNPLCITSLFTWMFYLTSAATGIESMSGLLNFILRGWLQLVMTYGIALLIVRTLSRPI